MEQLRGDSLLVGSWMAKRCWKALFYSLRRVRDFGLCDTFELNCCAEGKIGERRREKCRLPKILSSGLEGGIKSITITNVGALRGNGTEILGFMGMCSVKRQQHRKASVRWVQGTCGNS